MSPGRELVAVSSGRSFSALKQQKSRPILRDILHALCDELKSAVETFNDFTRADCCTGTLIIVGRRAVGDKGGSRRRRAGWDSLGMGHVFGKESLALSQGLAKEKNQLRLRQI